MNSFSQQHTVVHLHTAMWRKQVHRQSSLQQMLEQMSHGETIPIWLELMLSEVIDTDHFSRSVTSDTNHGGKTLSFDYFVKPYFAHVCGRGRIAPSCTVARAAGLKDAIGQVHVLQKDACASLRFSPVVSECFEGSALAAGRLRVAVWGTFPSTAQLCAWIILDNMERSNQIQSLFFSNRMKGWLGRCWNVTGWVLSRWGSSALCRETRRAAGLRKASSHLHTLLLRFLSAALF